MTGGRNIGDALTAFTTTLVAESADVDTCFLEIGERLGDVTTRVGALTRAFETLAATLAGEDFTQAAGAFTQVGARIDTLARARGDKTGVLARIMDRITEIERRVERMSGCVDGMAAVATNAKIAVASIHDPANELASFAGSIDGRLRLARATLGDFAGELTSVGRLVRTALAANTALEARQDAAVGAMGPRLRHGVRSLAARAARAADAARDVGERSRRIANDVEEAVMALQIGDITRQRVEHVETALRLLTAHLAVPPSAGLRDDRAGSAPIAGFICALQAALLTDAAEMLDHETERAFASLRRLAVEAADIQQFRRVALGAVDGESESFLGALEQDIAEVETLLAGFRATRREARDLAASVAAGTERLVGHIVSVRSLEADIRIMGLNMSLRSGRVGVAGRPLTVVAQALRGHAKEIAAHAGHIKTELDAIDAIAAMLSGEDADRGDTAMTAISETIDQSHQRLARAGDDVMAAASSLDRDGEVVAELLRGALTRAPRVHDIADAVRRSATALGGIAADPGYDAASMAPGVTELLERMAASYTMLSERRIFARHCPALSAPVPAPAEAAMLEDLLF